MIIKNIIIYRPEVYMVSDQAVNMERDNIFADNEDSRKYLKIRKPVDV